MFPVFPSSFFSMSSDSSGGQDTNFHEKDKKNSASVKLKIENFLPNNVSPSGSENAQRQVLKSEGVFAIEFLDQNDVSLEVATTDLLSYVPATKIGIKKSTGGVLKSTSKNSTHWLRNVKLSPDVHSHNALLELTPAKHVRMRISKKVLPGQEIIMWFSEEVAALMLIPFLTPANIRGNNCYTCHICHLSFETPNPLKIHLAIACGQQSIDILWIRLHCSLHRKSPTQHLSMSQDTPFRQLGHNQRCSAFKPITPGFYNPAISILPQTSSAVNINAAAQIETIVSNMGASKQGHLCIYCGKIYSRKYGLKIHIRTHTGFKPLKCKFCLRPFGDPSNLNKHVRLHMQTGGSTFKCHLCDKILARRRDLQRHMQARHCSNSSELKEKSSSSEDE